MRKYIIQRTLKLIPTMLGIITIVFFVYTAMPGTFADSISSLGDSNRISNSDALNAEANTNKVIKHYKLDSSQVEKFIVFVKQFFSGKLEMYQANVSRQPQPVYAMPIVADMTKGTLKFIALVIIFGICIAIPVSAKSVLLNKKKSNRISKWIMWICTSIPGFLIALIFIRFVFGSQAFFEYSLHNSVQSAKLKNLLINNIIPFLALSAIYVPKLTETLRANMVDISRKEYMYTARAYGISDRKIKYKYALKNAVVPIATFIGISFSSLFSDSIIIQAAVSDKNGLGSGSGLGDFLVRSILDRQYGAMMACLIVIIVIVVISNYLADMAYLIDPRIRKSLDNK